MTKAAKRVLSIAISVSLALHMSGCAWIEKRNTPPSYTEIEEIFLENQEDFSVIAQYLCDTNYELAQILNNDGTMYADLKDVDIDNDGIISAIERLFDAGCNRIAMRKPNNEIEFLLWKCSQEKRCGVAYSIYGGEPQVQFMTECEAFEEQGWYYYVADYNLWRTTNGSLPT